MSPGNLLEIIPADLLDIREGKVQLKKISGAMLVLTHSNSPPPATARVSHLSTSSACRKASCTGQEKCSFRKVVIMSYYFYASVFVMADTLCFSVVHPAVCLSVCLSLSVCLT